MQHQSVLKALSRVPRKNRNAIIDSAIAKAVDNEVMAIADTLIDRIYRITGERLDLFEALGVLMQIGILLCENQEGERK